MGDYFKPLRRKLGLVTLVMACVFMAAWVRSYSFTEQIIPPGQTSTFQVWISLPDRLAWMRVQGQGPSATSSLPIFTSAPSSEPYPIDSEEAQWHWRFIGFGSGTDNITGGSAHKYFFWTIPYWSIVIPPDAAFRMASAE